MSRICQRKHAIGRKIFDKKLGNNAFLNAHIYIISHLQKWVEINAGNLEIFDKFSLYDWWISLKILPTLTQDPPFRMQIIPLIISLTLLFSVLIIAATPPATGYELSMYGAYPEFLWVLISINIFFSIYTIIRSSDNQSNNLYYGYFSILLIETIIVFLPIIRGYFSMSRGAGDMYHHMFVASQILNSGYLPLTDYYPVMHIWLSIVYNFYLTLSF